RARVRGAELVAASARAVATPSLGLPHLPLRHAGSAPCPAGARDLPGARPRARRALPLLSLRRALRRRLLARSQRDLPRGGRRDGRGHAPSPGLLGPRGGPPPHAQTPPPPPPPR